MRMSREEAITALGDRNNLLWGMSKEEKKYYSEALDMAISALSDYDKMQKISLDLAFENDELINKMNELSADGDCISRQAVIDALTKTSGIRGDALKALYDLPSVENKEEWIPVSERLPEKNVWVLVTVEQSGKRFQEIMRRNNYIEAWTDNIDNYTDEIIAWLPLPEPYKAEKGGE